MVLLVKIHPLSVYFNSKCLIYDCDGYFLKNVKFYLFLAATHTFTSLRKPINAD